MSAYQKENGKWYELVNVDSFSAIEVEVEAPAEAEKPAEKPHKKAK